MKFDPGLRELADRRKTELKGIKSSEPQPSHKPEADKENDEQDELPF